MKSYFTDKARVLRSSYFLCSRLWDKLDYEVQLSKNVFEFVSKIKKIGSSALRDAYIFMYYKHYIYECIK